MHSVHAKTFCKKIKEFKWTQETSFCVIRQFRFFTGPNKLALVYMYESTFTGLVGPPYPYYSLVAFFICILTNFICVLTNVYKVKM